MTKKKKKTPSKGSPALSILSPEEQTRIQDILEDLDSIDPDLIPNELSAPHVARHLIERLPLDNTRSLSMVRALSKAFDQKEVQKAAKKAIFKLKQKGISIPEDNAAKSPPILFVKPEVEEPEAYVGPIDGAGSRPVFIACPQIPKGVQVGLGIVSDEKGILEFIFGGYSKKRMKEVRNLFFERFTPMVATSASHAATILEKAYGLNNTDATEALDEYRQMRPWIQDNVSLIERSPVYETFPPEGIATERVTPSQAQKLFEHALFASWLFDLEKMEAIAKDIKEAEGSTILISKEQKANRIQEIKEKAVADTYPEPRRIKFKDRLEETAYIFLKEGEEEQARTCLLAAKSLDQEPTFSGADPFLMAMLERTLNLYLASTGDIPRPAVEKEDKDGAPSIIIP
ncbi:MAG: hypothetical protein ACOWYE_10630 [Desulfatiglandales bacterium]